MASPPLPLRVLTVAKDKKGEFSTVQDAIVAVPLSNTCCTIIHVSPGVYNQPIYMAKTKNFITLANCCPKTTLLTWNNTASHINHHQTSLMIGVGTFGCGSVIVEGDLTHYSNDASGEPSSPSWLRHDPKTKSSSDGHLKGLLQGLCRLFP